MKVKTNLAFEVNLTMKLSTSSCLEDNHVVMTEINPTHESGDNCVSEKNAKETEDCIIAKDKPNNPSANSPKANEDDYDSDCLIIVETEESRKDEDGEGQEDVTSTSTVDAFEVNSKIIPQNCTPPHTDEFPLHLKIRGLPIKELKRKLAFCSICLTQYQNHKQANLCLSKHGKRQCWLCLEVMTNSKDTYFQHCSQKHAIGHSGEIVGCPYCHKFFDFRQGFNQHIVKVHFSEDTSYVSTTASLSPNSLVTLYTGQPLAKDGTQTRDHNEVSTTSNLNYQTPQEYNQSPSEKVLMGFQEPEDNQPFIPTPYNFPFPESYPSRRSSHYANMFPQTPNRSPTTRESVIRETPQANQTFPRVYPHPFPRNYQTTHHPYPQQHPFVAERRGGSDHYGKVAFFPPHPYFRIRLLDKLSQKSHVLPKFCSVSKFFSYSPKAFSSHGNLGKLPTLQNSQCARGVEECQRYCSTPNPTNWQPPRSNCQHFNDYCINRPAPMSSYVGAKDNPRTAAAQCEEFSYRTTSSPTYSVPLPSSPSLAEMEKLVHTAPVHLQYYNSVKTMLRTVAECDPSAAQETFVQSQRSSFGFGMGPSASTGIPGYSPHQTQSIGIRIPRPPQPPRSLEAEDAASFKVPLNPQGIKRKILTKWDEHLETNKGVGPCNQAAPPYPCIVPSPSKTTSAPYSQSQVQIHTGLNPLVNYSSGESMGKRGPPSEDKAFWEQILKESNAMYGGRQGQGQQQGNAAAPHIIQSIERQNYDCFDSSQPSEYSITNVDVYQEQFRGQGQDRGRKMELSSYRAQGGAMMGQGASSPSSLYPKIMARVDHNGRPVGIFTADGQPCCVSNYCNRESSLIHSGVVSETNFSENQSQQYQQRIVRQPTGMNQSYEAQPIYRKRKSSVPVRLVQNPTDNEAVVQIKNPFEDEAPSQSQCPTQKKPPPPPLSQVYGSTEGSVNSKGEGLGGGGVSGGERGMKDANGQREGQSVGGRLLNYPTKLTSGDQIMEVSGGQVGQQNDTANASAGVALGPWDGSGPAIGIATVLHESFQQRHYGIDKGIGIGDGSKFHMGGSGGGGNGLPTWPPFSVCQRYNESTQNIMNRLKNLDKGKKGPQPNI